MTSPSIPLTAVALAFAFALPARAAHTVDTGTPGGSAIGAYAFDANDFYAGQVSFATGATITAAATHVLGGTAGETFSVVLYGDSAAHLPGNLLYSAQAVFGSDGWNGVSGLSGWNVGAGNYWVAFEIGAADTLGSGSFFGAVLDRGVPSPLARAAFNAGSGYQIAVSGLSFGVQLDATAAVAAVPEPAEFALMAAGLALLAPVVGCMRRTQQRGGANTAR